MNHYLKIRKHRMCKARICSRNLLRQKPGRLWNLKFLKYLKYLWLQDLLSRQLRKLLKCLKRANPQNRMQLPQRKLLISLSLNTQMRSQATLSL